MKQHNFFSFLLFSLLGISLFAQTSIGLKTIDIDGEKKINEEAIEALAYAVLNSPTDQLKDSLNIKLKEQLKNELSKSIAFTHAFENVQSISILTPQDSAFRLFNWNVPYSDGTFNYECILLKPNQEAVFLKNTTDTLVDNAWIPALYYSVIPKKTKFQTYYTLLGWKGNNRLTTKKVIDVIWFSNNGELKFGAPIFQDKKEKKTRIVFEFAAQNAMKLNYNSTLDRIEFDHLSPPRQSLTGIYEYYAPDLSFDAYVWQGDKWVLEQDLYINKVNADKELKKPSKREQFEEKDFIIEDKASENKSLFEPK